MHNLFRNIFFRKILIINVQNHYPVPNAYHDPQTRLHDRLDKVYNAQVIKYKTNDRTNTTLNTLISNYSSTSKR